MAKWSAVVAVTALVVAGAMGSAPATAVDELVTVSGTVTGAPGDTDFMLTFYPLGGPDSEVYDHMAFADPDFTAEVPPGRYRVHIDTAESATAYLGGSLFAAGSEVLVVPSTGTTLDIVLSADFGSISGTVDGFPAGLQQLITVEAFAYDAATNRGGAGRYDATLIGDGFNGAFTIAGLTPGTYQLRGYSDPDVGGATRYLPERTIVTVSAGSTTDVGALTFTEEPIDFERVSGADRFRTAAALSAEFFDAAATDAVFIASGVSFPDALSAGPAAAVSEAPVLLVPTVGIPASVIGELTRIAPSMIYVIGGPGAVSPASEAALGAYADEVVRISGPDRYATSRAVAEAFFDDPAVVYFATGRNFPDALAASAVAGALGGPLLLIDGRSASLDPATRALIGTFDAPMTIAGETDVVSAGIEAELVAIDPGVDRRGGNDRYRTAISLASTLGMSDTWFYATGTNFADATAGAAVAGYLGSPLRLVSPTCDPNYFALGYTHGQGPRTVVLIGGEAALPTASLRNC